MYRRNLLIILSLSFLIITATAAAPIQRVKPQKTSTLTFSTFDIGLWPEYDQPSMLVIYTMTLAQGTTFPAEVHLRIPTAAGTPNAVATGPSIENLFNVEYARREEGQWSDITIRTYVPVVRLEYYDPTLVQEGTLHRYKLHWYGPYDITQVYLQVQQPYGGTNLQIIPEPQHGTWISDGVLNYYNAEFGTIGAKQSFDLTVQYQKETSLLSVTGLQVKPTTPIDSHTAGRASIWSSVPWLLIVPLVIIFLLVGGAWYWRANIPDAVVPSIWKQREKKAEKGPSEDESEYATPNQGIHCHQCGRRSIQGDRFCRSCGTLLRVE